MLNYSETSGNVYLAFNQHIGLENKKFKILVHLTFNRAEHEMASDMRRWQVTSLKKSGVWSWVHTDLSFLFSSRVFTWQLELLLVSFGDELGSVDPLSTLGLFKNFLTGPSCWVKCKWSTGPPTEITSFWFDNLPFSFSKKKTEFDLGSHSIYFLSFTNAKTCLHFRWSGLFLSL